MNSDFIKLLGACIVLLNSYFSYAQIIYNPSFESYSNSSPTGWTPCDEFSTPDLQPGRWGVTNEASDGDRYIGLVTRGNLGPYANRNEDIEALILKPFVKGEQYLIKLDLAYSKEWGHFIDFSSTFLKYDNPVKLRVYGGPESCAKEELLWESPPVDHEEWRGYPITLSPQTVDVRYLILEANFVGDSIYFGNILIDNIIQCANIPPLVSDTSVCENRPFQLNVAIPDGTYLWQDGSTDSLYTISAAGKYQVTIANPCTEETFEINVQTRNCYCDTAQPIVTESFDTLICENTPLIIDAQTPGGVYLWDNGSVEPSLTVENEGLYTVEVSNLCISEIFEYEVSYAECRCEINVPNVFTPNNDGINEEFEIEGTTDIASFDLKILNRSGEMVYHSDQLYDFWDGTSHGSDLDAGVYYWIVDMTCTQGQSRIEKSLNGWVTILK